jgi:hypothetical protein
MSQNDKETLGTLITWADSVAILGRVLLLHGPHWTRHLSDNLCKMSATRVMASYLAERQMAALYQLQSYKATNGLESGLHLWKISHTSQVTAQTSLEVCLLTELLINALVSLIDE